MLKSLPYGESEGSAIDNSDGSQKSEKLNTLSPSIPRQAPEWKSKESLINWEAAAVSCDLDKLIFFDTQRVRAFGSVFISSSNHSQVNKRCKMHILS